MAGEAVRPVANFPDDFQTVFNTIPIVGTGSAIDIKVPLFALDDDIIVDALWVAVPGTTTLNVALGTNVAANFFKAPATDKVVAGIAGNSVRLATELVCGGTVNSVANDTTAARKQAVISTAANLVAAGSIIAVNYTTSASVAAADAVAEHIMFGMRYHTKRTFVGGSDSLAKK